MAGQFGGLVGVAAAHHAVTEPNAGGGQAADKDRRAHGHTDHAQRRPTGPGEFDDDGESDGRGGPHRAQHEGAGVVLGQPPRPGPAWRSSVACASRRASYSAMTWAWRARDRGRRHSGDGQPFVESFRGAPPHERIGLPSRRQPAVTPGTPAARAERSIR